MTSEITFAVDGMTCGHCVGTVESTLEQAPGVEAANVDLEAGRASIRAAEDIDIEALVDAVAQAGYTMRALAADE